MTNEVPKHPEVQPLVPTEEPVKYERPVENTDWQDKIKTVLETFRAAKNSESHLDDLPDVKNPDDLKDAEKMLQGIPTSEFLKRSPEDLRTLFLDGNTVNFHGHAGAVRFIGAGDLFPSDQAFLSIDGVVGKRSRSASGKVGYLDKSGKYLPIFGGEKIDTNAPTEQKNTGFERVLTLTAEEETKSQEAFQQNLEILDKEESDLIREGAEPLKGQALLDDPDFSQKLDEVCQHLGIERSWLENAMRKESSVNTKACNSDTGATGLIQFMPETAYGLGTSTGALRKMKGVDQLAYVEKYYEPYAGQIRSPEDLYLATFYPAAIGKPDNFVIGSDQSDEYARLVAEQNPAISGGKAYATKADVERFINA